MGVRYIFGNVKLMHFSLANSAPSASTCVFALQLICCVLGQQI